MTIGFTKKLLVIGGSAMLLALGAAPAGFAGEDDGPTANGEQVGTTLNGSSGSSGSSGGSSSNSSGSAKSGVKAAQKTLAANTSDTTQAVGGVQTGFGGMAETAGGSVLFALLLGLGGVAMIGAARLNPSARRFDR